MQINTILLLTACVNPGGMSYTQLNNPDKRRQQYENALNWYLTNTTLPILFVENSGTEIEIGDSLFANSNRLEMLTFNGNDYDKTLGKGYGEAKILQYAFEHSQMLKNKDAASLIIKMTGRFVCKNIEAISKRYQNLQTIYANIDKDDWGGNVAISNIVIAPALFWTDYFLLSKEKLNDSKRYHFEHLLYDSICAWKSKGYKHREFWMLPEMEGFSGTTGSKTYSSNKRNIYGKIMYILHKLGYRGYLNPFYKGNPTFVINGK